MNISELRRKGFEISFYTSVPKIMIMFYCSWDMACVRCNCYFPFWAFFSPFTPLTAQKMKISQKSKKKKKNTWRYQHLPQVYQKSWSYAILLLRYGVWRMQLSFFILVYFLPFYPTNSQKNEYFKTMKKMPGGIIILHKCIKTHDHMLYCS